MIELILALCLLFGLDCSEHHAARVTIYAPGLMDEMNGSPPYDMTASGLPVEYGTTAACSQENLGMNVWIEGVGARQCTDIGGWITGTDVDVAIPVDDCVWVNGFCWHPWSSHRQVVFWKKSDRTDSITSLDERERTGHITSALLKDDSRLTSLSRKARRSATNRPSPLILNKAIITQGTITAQEWQNE